MALLRIKNCRTAYCPAIVSSYGHYVFPPERTPRGDRCMSENTLNAALKRLGYVKDVMTAHGFRAMARTILDEVLGFRPDFIEHQPAHAVKDPTAGHTTGRRTCRNAIR
jgi:integrase